MLGSGRCVRREGSDRRRRASHAVRRQTTTLPRCQRCRGGTQTWTVNSQNSHRRLGLRSCGHAVSRAAGWRWRCCCTVLARTRHLMRRCGRRCAALQVPSAARSAWVGRERRQSPPHPMQRSLKRPDAEAGRVLGDCHSDGLMSWKAHGTCVGTRSIIPARVRRHRARRQPEHGPDRALSGLPPAVEVSSRFHPRPAGRSRAAGWPDGMR